MYVATPLRTALAVILLGTALGTLGCQKQKSSEEGKVYTSTKPNSTAGGAGGSGGGSASSSSQQPSASKPLNSPAATVNLRASQASDNGSTQASEGQVITNPGAPNARDAKAAGPPPKGATPTGSH